LFTIKLTATATAVTIGDTAANVVEVALNSLDFYSIYKIEPNVGYL